MAIRSVESVANLGCDCSEHTSAIYAGISMSMFKAFISDVLSRIQIFGFFTCLMFLCEYLFKLTIRMVKLETRQYDSIRSAIRIAPFFEAMREPSMTAGCEALLSREASGCETALSREALLV